MPNIKQRDQHGSARPLSQKSAPNSEEKAKSSVRMCKDTNNSGNIEVVNEEFIIYEDA